MTVEMNLHTSNGARVFSALPDPDRIPIKPVRNAVEKVASRLAKFREADARARLADAALHTVTTEIEKEAAEAAEKGGVVETKKLSKRRAAAEAALDEARLEVRAREHAVVKAHGDMIETILHHTPAWHAHALEKADAAVLKLTTARRQVEIAAAELAEPLGVLSMLGRLPIDGLPVMTAPGKSGMYVSMALDDLTMAVGEAIETSDVFKGAETSKPDVVVPVPGEDTIDEPTTHDEFAIVAGADDDDE